MNRENYVKDVIKRLECSKKRRVEIGKELQTDIQSALEQGETWEDVSLRMGHPAAVASEFNENTAETEKKKYKTGRRVKVGLFAAGLLVLLCAVIYLILPKTFSLDKSKVFSQKEVTQQTEQIIMLLDQEKYSVIRDTYSDKRMQKALTDTVFQKAEQAVKHTGSYSKITSVYTVGMSQMGHQLAVVQMTALYRNSTVTYTITFNSNMKLSGLYMK